MLVFLSFDDEQQTREWYGGRDGYRWTGEEENFFAGGGALEIRHEAGTHKPREIMRIIEETDVAYVRWYRKWEEGYDFTQHKMPGVYARADRNEKGGAGEAPTGHDKFSCKLYVSSDRHPRLYSYHPEQKGRYGDGLAMNLIGEEYVLQAGRWYCFEMMIKANTVGRRDGELRMWVDGKPVALYTGMRFRDTPNLRINQFIYSAYVGGKWVSRRSQRLWDDQVVVARSYIGPMTFPVQKE